MRACRGAKFAFHPSLIRVQHPRAAVAIDSSEGKSAWEDFLKVCTKPPEIGTPVGIRGAFQRGKISTLCGEAHARIFTIGLRRATRVGEREGVRCYLRVRNFTTQFRTLTLIDATCTP